MSFPCPRKSFNFISLTQPGSAGQLFYFLLQLRVFYYNWAWSPRYDNTYQKYGSFLRQSKFITRILTFTIVSGHDMLVVRNVATSRPRCAFMLVSTQTLTTNTHWELCSKPACILSTDLCITLRPLVYFSFVEETNIEKTHLLDLQDWHVMEQRWKAMYNID